MMLLTFREYRDVSEKVAAALGCPFAEIAVHRFPDGETRITVPPLQSERVAICRTLNDPNAKLVELMLAAKTARARGARHLALVAPYLCYMRQDTAFHAGEAVSQHIVGQWLADFFDHVVTVEPHLHRIKTLAEAVPAREAVALSAASAMGAFVRRNVPDALLVGPDEESEQWVAAIAREAGAQSAVALKVRHGDHETTVELPECDYSSRHIVLVDDIASSGGTLISAARACHARGVARVDALVVHALLDDDAVQRLRAARINNIWSTNSVPHFTNAISLVPLLADHLSTN